MRHLQIAVDTREQNPLDFSMFEDVSVNRRELWPGDYSLIGATNFLAIERKSVADFIGTMKTGYAGFGSTTPKRFDRELKALRGYALAGFDAFILIEPDSFLTPNALEQIKAGNYRSMIEPSKVLSFVKTIRSVWQVPVIFAESRKHAAEIVVAAARKTDAVRRIKRNFDKEITGIIGEAE